MRHQAKVTSTCLITGYLGFVRCSILQPSYADSHQLHDQRCTANWSSGFTYRGAAFEAQSGLDQAKLRPKLLVSVFVSMQSYKLQNVTSTTFLMSSTQRSLFILQLCLRVLCIAGIAELTSAALQRLLTSPAPENQNNEDFSTAALHDLSSTLSCWLYTFHAAFCTTTNA